MKQGFSVKSFAWLLLVVLLVSCNNKEIVLADKEAILAKDSTAIVVDMAPSDATSINWLSWEEMQNAQKTEPRMVLVDVYTDWCGWCKKMDKNTFQDPQVLAYINKHYYAVKFDAETEEDIEFDGNTYSFVPGTTRGYNELAASLLSGNLSYPTIVFLDKELGLAMTLPGYQTAPSLEPIMVYLGEHFFEDYTYQQFKDHYVTQIR